MFKLFSRRPESAPVAPQPRERHRPTLPPLHDAGSKQIDALLAIGASAGLEFETVASFVASAIRPPTGTNDEAAKQIEETQLYIQYSSGDDQAKSLLEICRQLGTVPGSAVDVQAVIDAIQERSGQIQNTTFVSRAISELYPGCADLGIDPDIRPPVFTETRPILPTYVDGDLLLHSLSSSGQYPIVSVPQPLDVERVSVRAVMKKDPFVLEELHLARFGTKPPQDRMSAEHQTMIEGFALRLIQEERKDLRAIATGLRWDRQVRKNDEQHGMANAVAGVAVALMRFEDGVRRAKGLLSRKI